MENDLLKDLHTAIMDALRPGLRRRETAGAIAKSIVDSIVDRWGGTAVYVPKGRAAKAARLSGEIHRRFDGSNARALSLEFGITTMHVRRIVRRGVSGAASRTTNMNRASK